MMGWGRFRRILNPFQPLFKKGGEKYQRSMMPEVFLLSGE
jgi:hypothetical protein